MGRHTAQLGLEQQVRLQVCQRLRHAGMDQNAGRNPAQVIDINLRHAKSYRISDCRRAILVVLLWDCQDEGRQCVH